MVGPPSRELRKQRLFCFLGLSGGGFLFVPSLTKKWRDHMNTQLKNKELKNPQGQKTEPAATGTIPVRRLALTAGLCFGLLAVLVILKHVFKVF